MQQVLFVELSIDKKNHYICDIIEKLYLQGKRIHVFVKERSKALQLNRDLWVWKPDSFIPHITFFENNENGQHFEEPVVITTRSVPEASDVLILHDPVNLEEARRYPLVIDFAEVYNDQKLNASRQRFKAFRDSGWFEVAFSKLGAFLKNQ